eukprot:COSAG02_NODE_64355_length_260_cov_2.180124_1_plen_21_part_10
MLGVWQRVVQPGVAAKGGGRL